MLIWRLFVRQRRYINIIHVRVAAVMFCCCCCYDDCDGDDDAADADDGDDDHDAHDHDHDDDGDYDGDGNDDGDDAQNFCDSDTPALATAQNVTIKDNRRGICEYRLDASR